MANLKADCPRCGTVGVSLQVRGQNYLGMQYGWRKIYEVFAVCGHCHRSVIYKVEQREAGHQSEVTLTDNAKSLTSYQGYINDWVNEEGFLSLKDHAVIEPPQHLPPLIETAFREAATCHRVQCWNAAGAMFRSCLDLATKDVLPKEGEPTGHVRRSLGLRLKWLFDNGLLPQSLVDLSHCIQQDGNDGAHDVTLTSAEVEDINDFTVEVLETLYTIPKRLKLAEERRSLRRQKPDGADGGT